MSFGPARYEPGVKNCLAARTNLLKITPALLVEELHEVCVEETFYRPRFFEVVQFVGLVTCGNQGGNDGTG